MSSKWPILRSWYSKAHFFVSKVGYIEFRNDFGVGVIKIYKRANFWANDVGSNIENVDRYLTWPLNLPRGRFLLFQFSISDKEYQVEKWISQENEFFETNVLGRWDSCQTLIIASLLGPNQSKEQTRCQNFFVCYQIYSFIL